MHIERGYLLVLIASAMLLGIAACSPTAATPTESPTLVPTETALPAPTETPIPEPTATARREPTSTPLPAIQPGDHERTVRVNDRERSYLLYVPPELNTQEPVPLMLAFHDVRMAASGMRAITDFNEIAAEAKFLVAYPQGIGNSWNVEPGVWGDASAENVDEHAFIRQILKDLRTIASIDPARVYAAGFGQGAGMVYTLACDMASTFAAIGPVAGTIRTGPCEPEEAVSVIHVHGMADGVQPYGGMEVEYRNEAGRTFVLPSVDEAVETWAQAANCDGSEVERLSETVTHTVHTDCEPGTGVELYGIEKLTHRWPRENVFPASETIWSFSAARAKP